MDRWLAFVLLLVGVAAAIHPPPRLPSWAIPVSAAALDVLLGGSGWGQTWRDVHPLLAPVAFLLCAVPLAVMLDKLGFFAALASRVTAKSAGPGYLWALAAVVTTVLNLDAAVVLLTPLYVRVARQREWDVVVLAAQPVLLACLASSALPVSNLTNLIAASWTGAITVQFLAHLGAPSIAATGVGWLCYRRMLQPRGKAATVPQTEGRELEKPQPEVARHEVTDRPGGRSDLRHRAQADLLLGDHGPERPGPPPAPARPAVRIGAAVILAVLIGFTCGPLVGLQPWLVAMTADLVMVIVLLRQRQENPGVAWAKQVPLRSVPAGTAVTVLALGVLATQAAGYLPLGPLLRGGSVLDLARDSGLAALGANVVNNLPTLLVALPHIGHHVSPSLWAVLLGVNMGPVVLVTGSLASLLWLSTLRRLGVEAAPSDFTRVGLRAGLPAAMAALAVALLWPAF